MSEERKQIKRAIVKPSKIHVNKTKDIKLEEKKKEISQKKKRLEKEKEQAKKAEQERLEKERIEKEKAEQERLEKERIEKEKAEQERLEIIQKELEKNELKEEINQENEEKLKKLRKEMEEKMKEPHTSQFVSSIDNSSKDFSIKTIPVETRKGRYQNKRKYGNIKEKNKLIITTIMIGLFSVFLIFGAIFGIYTFKNLEINKINGNLSTTFVDSKSSYIKLENHKIPSGKTLPFDATEDMIIKEKYNRFNQSLTISNKKAIIDKILKNTINPPISQILATSKTKELKNDVQNHIIGTISIPKVNINEDIINGISEWNALYGVSTALPYNVLGKGDITLTGSNTGFKNTLLSNLVNNKGECNLSKGDFIFLKANGKVKAQYKVTNIKIAKLTPNNALSTEYKNKLTLIVNNKAHFNNSNERMIITAEKQ